MLTWDQGAEMAKHAQIRIDVGLAIYSCDPLAAHGSAAPTRTPTGSCASSTILRGQGVEAVRLIRDEIERRVRVLFEELDVVVTA